MSYALIDSSLNEWALRNGLLLEKQFAGTQARFCYLSNTLGDTVQIYVTPAANGEYLLVADLIESLDDEREARAELVANAQNITPKLEQILSAAKGILLRTA